MDLPSQQAYDPEIWEPQSGPQTLLLSCEIEDVFIGGARGGGKTIGLLLDWASHADLYGKHARGAFFRRTYPELEEVEAETKKIYPGMGASWNTQRRTWTWPRGAMLRMRYLARDTDADHYQGHSYTAVYFDEIGAYPSLKPVDKLRACLRSGAGVPCVFRCSGNPGGPGHNQVKARYIDPAPPLTPFCDVIRLPDGTEAQTWRVFIPATLDDNPKLMQADPNYWQRVSAAASGNEALLKAWRYGMWNVVAGGMMDDLWNPEVHIVEPFPIPHNWYVDRAFDWGSSAPFATLWFAESNGETVKLKDDVEKTWPRGTVFIVAEDYGWNGKPNEGLRLSNTEIARRVVQAEQGALLSKLSVKPGPADTQIFEVESGHCIAADMEKGGVRWEKADKGPGSRITGWKKIRDMLKASLQKPMGEPGLFVFSTCRQVIRTLPVLPRDEKHNLDDVDTDSEDHIGDTLRYRLLYRRKMGGSREVGGV